MTVIGVLPKQAFIGILSSLVSMYNFFITCSNSFFASDLLAQITVVVGMLLFALAPIGVGLMLFSLLRTLALNAALAYAGVKYYGEISSPCN